MKDSIREPGNVVIKFDMNDDNKIREQARKEYEMAKSIKLAKLPLYKFYSASEISARNQFRLSEKTDLTIIEVKLTNNQEKNIDIINDVRDFISSQENIEYKDDKIYVYEETNKVQRFLVHCK